MAAASPSSASPAAGRGQRATPPPKAVPVTLLPLGGALADAEISGLAWWGDWLVLLPQDPASFAPAGALPGEGRVFALPRRHILEALQRATRKGDADRARALLQPRPVPFLAAGVAEAVPDFDGFEAVGFRGNAAYVTVESGRAAADMAGFVVKGRVTGALDTLRLDARTTTALPEQAFIENFSYEALGIGARGVLAFYESNGQVRNPRPQAVQLGHDLKPQAALSFPHLEYRVTDATLLDAQGRFWVTNYYWPGDSTRLRPVPDPHQPAPATRPPGDPRVERLVELRRTPQGIVRVPRPPIWLRLDAGAISRNWEGLARLEGHGLLLATDEFPRTLLGFVPQHMRAVDSSTAGNTAADTAGTARATARATAQEKSPLPSWWGDTAEVIFMVLAGLAVALFGLIAARHPAAAWKFTRARFRRGAVYGLSLTVAVVLAGAAFWAFTEVTKAWTQAGTVYRLDAAAEHLANAWASPGLNVFMRGATWLGSGWAAGLIVGAVAVWLYRREGGRRALAMLLVGAGAGEALVYGLKALFHRTRPSGGISAMGASFPSGHAFTALVVYGLLAYLLWRAPVRRQRWWQYAGTGLLVLVVLLVGASRIYLRAHYFTDVVGSYALGAGWLAVAFALVHLLRARTAQ